MNNVLDNIVFLDTEFSSLDPYKGEILSIGLVKPTGEELYIELEYEGPMDDWPKKHILPTLKNPIPREEAKKRILEFLGSAKPLTVAFIDHFDIIYLHKLFGWKDDDFPFGFPPIDLSSFLLAKGYDPMEYLDHQAEFAQKLGLDYSNITQHHALSDARFIKMVWEKITNYKEKK